MVINHLITPYKINRPVIQASGKDGAFDSRAVDAPFPFRHNGRFYMMYIGFDGTGYQTGLAVSDDLIEWEPLGVILKRGANRQWDFVGMAGTCIIMDNYDLYGCPKPKKINGKYWLFYHAYPGKGYETGPAAQGIAYTEDENLLDWHFCGDPVYTCENGGDWEAGGLYKCFVVENGGKYHMFYNAKNRGGNWIEQTGTAVSGDMFKWERHEKNPVLPVTKGAWDGCFASDPAVWYDSMERQWVMFYYGFNGKTAADGIAVSQDLYNWEKFPAPVLTAGQGGDIDVTYAHKPGIIYQDGALYHYYCACRPYKDGDGANNGGEFRCISLARSKPWV
ncbi:MAG: hypothetical protein FWD23_08875, partial [Oscillospiraceae bacterium]|nr:hypothetical protein [Oscillospiraceae bacterium]